MDYRAREIDEGLRYLAEQIRDGEAALFRMAVLMAVPLGILGAWYAVAFLAGAACVAACRWHNARKALRVLPPPPD